jgi:hypothetical protein
VRQQALGGRASCAATACRPIADAAEASDATVDAATATTAAMTAADASAAVELSAPLEAALVAKTVGAEGDGSEAPTTPVDSANGGAAGAGVES